MIQRITLTQYESQQRFEDDVTELLREQLQLAGSTPHAIMLSGGRTPLPIFDRFAKNPVAASRSAHILYSDERHVPEDSSESNYGASLSMLRALELPQHQIIQVDTALSLEAAASKYDQDLRRFLKEGGQISLAFIGLGTDGHTCSLFTQEDLERSAGNYAIAVQRPNPPHRISVTPELLEQVQRVIILASGPDKTQIVEDLLHDPTAVVAGRALVNCQQVELWRV